MHGDELVAFGLLVAVMVLLIVAYRTQVPYPILLVVGSAGIALIPGMPTIDVDPDVILVLALPPLLYAAAFFTSLHELRDNIKSVGLLAVGLVVFTTVLVGVVAHELIGLDWNVAFVLGAVVSPTDPVAATAIAGRLGAPRRYVTIVEGESLVNDATGLVIYKIAVAAVVTGTFSIAQGAVDFVAGAAGGIAIGLLVGVLIGWIRRPIDDPTTEITISLLTAYFAYLPAEAAGVSAVLATVTTGVYLGWTAPHRVSPQTRLEAYAFWNIVTFVLNGALFVIVGLQLRSILDDLAGESAGSLATDALIVFAAVVAVRFLWVYPVMAGPAWLLSRIRGTDPSPLGGKGVFLVAFTGMRGAVSMAAALAIPLTLDSGQPFPDRDLVIFLAYAVIVGTLVIQGLLLPVIIAACGFRGDADARREDRARIRATEAAIARLEELSGEDWVPEGALRRMRAFYEQRIRRFAARFDDEDDGELEESSQAYGRLRREALEAERVELLRLRDEGELPDEVMRRIERDLDIAEVQTPR